MSDKQFLFIIKTLNTLHNIMNSWQKAILKNLNQLAVLLQ